jgi:hypothetical protein
MMNLDNNLDLNNSSGSLGKLEPNIKAYSQTKLKKKATSIFNTSDHAESVKNILNKL